MLILAAHSNLNYITHLPFTKSLHSSLDVTASQKPSAALKLEQINFSLRSCSACPYLTIALMRSILTIWFLPRSFRVAVHLACLCAKIRAWHMLVLQKYLEGLERRLGRQSLASQAWGLEPRPSEPQYLPDGYRGMSSGNQKTETMDQESKLANETSHIDKLWVQLRDLSKHGGEWLRKSPDVGLGCLHTLEHMYPHMQTCIHTTQRDTCENI